MAVKRKTIDLGKSMQEFDERIEAQKASTPSILETLAPIEEHPKKKEVKQVYQVIEIYFDSALTMVNSVKMVEKTGDTTMVTLTNTKNNIAINESLFDIH